MAVGEDDFNLDNSSHPGVALVTWLFKGLSLSIYLFFSLFLSSTYTFILTTLCSILDFWITKNVAGRRLVGLRWWRGYDRSGQETFLFESQPRDNRVDSTLFWTSLLASTLLWFLFLLLNVLGLNLYWSIMTAVQFSLSALNLYGYYLCRAEH